MTLQERFLRYVKINTTSDENGQGCPSAACEWELARLLADEMRAMGVSNVRLDAHAYVYGEIPANCEHAPAIGLIAHMDTVDAVPGRAFHPRVVEYQGGDICLNAEKGIVLSEKDFPELSQRRGKHLIVTDGTTVLGADDKAGVAEIMTLCERVLQDVMYDLPEHEGASTVTVRASDITGETKPEIVAAQEEEKQSA